MAFIPSSNSVVAFQSDPTKLVGTVSVVGNMNSSVTAFQGTNPWIVNQPSPSIISYQLAGSVMAVNATVNTGNSSVQLLGGVNTIGSVVAVQGTNPFIMTGSVQGVMSVVGTVPVTQATTPWVVNVPTPSLIMYQAAGSILAVSATVNTGNSSVQLLQGVAVIGSVAVLQGTSPWLVNVPTPSYISYQAAGSVMAVSGNFTSGNTSVTAFQGGAWSTSVTGGYVNIIGSVALGVGNTSVTQAGAWNVNVNSILGTYQERNASTPSVIGIPILYKIDTTNSVLTAVSPTNPFPVQGSLTTLQGTNPWIVQVVGSIAGASITTLQGTTPWIVNVPTPSYLSIQPAGSVLNANISGSVAAAITNFTASVAANINVISASIAVNQGTNPWVIGSIVGTHADNSAWTEGNQGLETLATRNDTMSSVSAADVRYSPFTVGPIGETIIANSPITKWIQGNGSVFTGTSIQVLAAQGTSIFTYITGIQMINPSANNAYVTFTQGLGAAGASTIGWGIVPANGGTNMTFPNPLRTLDNRGISASVSAVASIYVMMQGFISKT